MAKGIKISFILIFMCTPQFIMFVAIGGVKGFLLAVLVFAPYFLLGRMYELSKPNKDTKNG